VIRAIWPVTKAWPATAAGCFANTDLEAARLQGGTIERAVVYGSRGGDNDAMTEGVLAASIERDAGLELALRDAGEIGQRAVVIEVTVTYDESVGVRRIDLQEDRSC
jgi:hypothetical protein